MNPGRVPPPFGKREIIRRLVGEVTEEQLRYVDSFLSDKIGVFMPVGGACFYALTPLHSHPGYMVTLPFNDQTVIKIHGRLITTMPGKIFILSPGIPHQELPSDFPPRYIALLIDKEFFEAQASRYRPGGGLYFPGESHDAPPEFLPLLKQFMSEAEGGMPGSDTVLEALGILVCHSVIRGVLGVSPPKDEITTRIELDRAVEYMYSNLERKITLDELAGAAYMSPSHFAREFKKAYGKSPVDYLNHTRMERVKKLLLAGDKLITDIAFECGFQSPSYLSACFRKKYRMSPSEFQKSLKRRDF